jgi:hypothetical protein
VFDNPSLPRRYFPSGNTFQYHQTGVLKFVGLNINQIGARQSVLSDENWLLISLDISDNFGSFSFEGGHKFGSHE